MENISKTKKNILIAMIIIIVITLIGTIVIIKSTHRTPRIEGKVIDELTGEPIEKVIIQVIGMETGQRISGSPDPVMSNTIITGKDGKYVIPSTSSIHLFSDYADQYIFIYHPLYLEKVPEGVEGTGGDLWHRLTKKEKEKYKQNPSETIYWDIKMTPLEEAIRRRAEEYARTKSFETKFIFSSHMDSYSGSFFKEHWDRKFVEDVLKKWEEISGKDSKNLQRIIERLKKEVEEAYKGEK